jgi:hypothetical protein
VNAAPPLDPGSEFLVRLGRVEATLRDHAGSGPAPGLTPPDPPTGERWDWGQVWAHLGEFVPYWLEQIRLILNRPAEADPVAFGRVKSDLVRVAAIAADRGRPPPELFERLERHVAELREQLGAMPPQDWRRRGLHSALGVMDMPRIVEEFLVGHLEAHAGQLDELAAGVRPGEARPRGGGSAERPPRPSGPRS